LGTSALELNLQQIPQWAASFHVPDVIFFGDIPHAPHVFLELALRRLRAGGHDGIEFFPYPKATGKLRWFVLLSPTDLVISRTLAGEIAERTDKLLPPAVFSSRLAAPPPRWRFRDFRAAHKDMRHAAQTLAERYGGMTKTDIRNYYPSINTDRLRTTLLGWGADDGAVNRLVSMLEGWRLAGCSGIPVGGEAFAVLGNAYVLPLDLRLVSSGVPFVRWADDILVFGRHFLDRVAAIELIDNELFLLELDRAAEKTEDYPASAAAIAHIEDGMLNSLFAHVRKIPRSTSRGLVRDRFVEHVVEAEEVEGRHYRALLRTLQNCGDDYATHWFAIDPSLLNVDPAVAGDYLTRMPPKGVDGDALVDLLRETQPAERDILDARDLHVLRGLSCRRWGTAEGEVFWDIASDTTRRGPVRAWAITAAASTPALPVGEVLERVLEEENPAVRRALVVSLRESNDDQRVRSLFRHIRTSVPDLIPPVAWASR
jgi:hypothetical protein